MTPLGEGSAGICGHAGVPLRPIHSLVVAETQSGKPTVLFREARRRGPTEGSAFCFLSFIGFGDERDITDTGLVPDGYISTSIFSSKMTLWTGFLTPSFLLASGSLLVI